MSTEGIFRKNGNIRRLKELVQELDNDPIRIKLENDNCIQIAALIKKFLRDMPDPLLTNSLYEIFLFIPKIQKSDRIMALHLLLCLLPKPNIDLLSVIVRFLCEVSTFSANKMDLSNLATVIAPNILYSTISSPEQSGITIDIVKTILIENKNIFKVSF